MNREILFKAKRIDNGEWVEGYYQVRKDVFENDEHLIFRGESYHTWEYAKIDPSTLCQFTGLTDKNGKKIWENDIVESDTGKAAKVVYGEYNCSCCHGVYGWTFEPIGNYHSHCDIRKTEEVEVIGNIIDSPKFW